jgi:hypothetical protein
MAKKENQILEFSVLAAVIFAFVLFIFQIRTGDINLCRAIFSDLTNGRYGVQKYVDWENLKGLTIDAGATYSSFSTEKEKAGYKKAFIQGFSWGFKKIGGKSQLFVNWRVYNKGDNQVIIAADYRGTNKTLLLTLSGAGRKKLTSLQWK